MSSPRSRSISSSFRSTAAQAECWCTFTGGPLVRRGWKLSVPVPLAAMGVSRRFEARLLTVRSEALRKTTTWLGRPALVATDTRGSTVDMTKSPECGGLPWAFGPVRPPIPAWLVVLRSQAAQSGGAIWGEESVVRPASGASAFSLIRFRCPTNKKKL